MNSPCLMSCSAYSGSIATSLFGFTQAWDDEPETERAFGPGVIDGLVSVTQQAWLDRDGQQDGSGSGRKQ
jgi:hypothetical protein